MSINRTPSDECEQWTVQDIIPEIILRVEHFEPPKDTTHARVCSTICTNDNGFSVKICGWRAQADRLNSYLKRNNVLQLEMVRAVDRGAIIFNTTSAEFQLLFLQDSVCTVIATVERPVAKSKPFCGFLNLRNGDADLSGRVQLLSKLGKRKLGLLEGQQGIVGDSDMVRAQLFIVGKLSDNYVKGVFVVFSKGRFKFDGNGSILELHAEFMRTDGISDCDSKLYQPIMKRKQLMIDAEISTTKKKKEMESLSNVPAAANSAVSSDGGLVTPTSSASEVIPVSDSGDK